MGVLSTYEQSFKCLQKEGGNLATEELECCEDCQIHPDRLDIVNSGMPEEEELYDLADLRYLEIRRESVFCLCCLKQKFVSVISQRRFI